MSGFWRKDISPTTLYIYKEEPFQTYTPYRNLVGKPKREEIEEIIVEAGHPRLISVDNCLIDEKTYRLLLVCKHSKIPPFIKSIGQDVFEYGIFLDRMEIPNGVKEICWGAFSRCKGLTEIEIPNSVTTIGPFAFGACSDLTEIKLPNSVKTIQSDAFSSCHNLRTVILSDKLKTLKKDAFAYCKSLEYIRFGADIKYIGAGAFRDCNKVVIHAPAGSYAEEYAKKHDIPFRAIL